MNGRRGAALGLIPAFTRTVAEPAASRTKPCPYSVLYEERWLKKP